MYIFLIIQPLHISMITQWDRCIMMAIIVIHFINFCRRELVLSLRAQSYKLFIRATRLAFFLNQSIN